MQAALFKAQKLWGVDIFIFGEAVHRKFPDEWKELEKRWDEEFPQLEVSIAVKAELRRIGMSIKPKKAAE